MSDLKTTELLRSLGVQRWAVPVMAFLDQEEGSRFAIMLRRYQLSRHTLTRLLDYLTQKNWIMTNPGHGHPLRPEYVLTEEGRIAAALCSQIMEVWHVLGIQPGQMTRWSLPLTHVLGNQPQRFGDLEQYLTPVSPRALSITLKHLMEYDLIHRQVEGAFPPTAFYSLAPRGLILSKALVA